MFRATLRGLLAHRLRLVLTGIAITLAVAFISGTYIFTDSLNSALTSLIKTGQADVIVTPQSRFAQRFRDESQTPTLPAGDVARVRGIPGVADAVGLIDVRNVSILGPDGKPLDSNQGPSSAGHGQGWIPNPALSVVRLDSGSAPATPEQVVIDSTTAKRAGLTAGSQITVVLPDNRTVQSTITGLVSRTLASVGGAGSSIVVWDEATAARLLLPPATVTAIRAQTAGNATQAQVAEAIRAAIPTGVSVQTGDEAADNAAATLEQRLGFLNTVLLIFALISVFVAAFLIYNTFSMLVAQRTRELALFRAIGATRRQVTGSVLVEAGITAVVATTLGIFAGMLLAQGLRQIFSAFGVPLPDSALVLLPRTAVVAYGVGVGVTLISAWLPSRRAAAIPPVAALRADVGLPAQSLRRRTWIGLVLLLGAVALAVVGLQPRDDSTDSATFVGLSAATALLALLVLAPSLSNWALRVLSAPVSHRVVGRLARENGRRNPRRTAATAGALMIGLALMGALSVVTSSITKSTDAIVDDVIGADFVVFSGNFRPFPHTVYESLDGTKGAEVTSFVRLVPALVSTGPADGSLITGVQPDKLPYVLNLSFTQGSLQALRPGTVVVDSKTAADQGVKVGDTVYMLSTGGIDGLQIVGLYQPAAVYSGYLTDIAGVDRMGANGQDSAVYIKAKPGADLQALRSELDAKLKPYPTLQLQDQTQIKDDIRDQVSQLLVFVLALLVLAVVIAVLGIVNTLALSVFERTREIGLLRAVGTSRAQIRRMVFIEAILIAVFGALLGVIIGVVYGVLLQRVLVAEGITELGVDGVQLLGFVVLAAAGGVLAAVWPAWRAARLNVLKAIATE